MAHRIHRAVLCAVLWTLTASAAHAQYSASAKATVPPPYAVTNAVSRWVPVCDRARPAGSGSYDTTDTYGMSVEICHTPSSVPVRALRLSYLGADISNDGIMDRIATETVTAAVRPPTTQYSAVVNAATSIPGSGCASIPSQVGQGALGNSLTRGEPISGTGIPSGSWINAVTPTYVSSALTSETVTFVNTSGACTITSALTAGQVLTVGGQNWQATFGGSTSATIPAVDRVLDSDPIGVALPGGSTFMVRTHSAWSTPGHYVGDYPSPTSGYTGVTRLTATIGGVALTEGDQRGTTDPGDHTMDAFIPSNSGGGYEGTWSVEGETNVPTVSVLMVGDSICAGTGDNPDSTGAMGYMQRSLEGIPHASLCRGSTSAVQMANRLQLIIQAAREISATDILLEYGRNDINAGGNPLSAATTESNLAAIAAPLIAAGYRVWEFTIPPTTASQDGWTSPTGQFLEATGTTLSAAIASGSTTVSVASTNGISAGEMIGLSAGTTGVFTPGTTLTVASATTLTLSSPAIGSANSGSTIYVGPHSPNASTPIELQREAFNTYQRENPMANGISGIIDMDAQVEDPNNTGLWRTDLGNASFEGIHPSQYLHNQLVTSGIINPTMFPVR